MNLLTETLEQLKTHGKTPKDVMWVGSTNMKTTWDNFEAIADIEYDDGFGAQEVATDLLIVGKDWWLERHEYDGSEWWEFKSLPETPKKSVKLTALTTEQARSNGVEMWYVDTLEKVNAIEATKQLEKQME